MFSVLTDKQILTDHYDGRGGSKVCKITIHHMAGNLSIETCGNVFQTREASANYGIGTDGRVGGYVPEEYRAWSTANYDNDKQAINIELANDGGAETNWHVSDTAIEKCIQLCVDICKRYGFTLNYTGDASGSLTRHNMFMATTCPGGYLQSKFPYIAEEVNKRLTESQPKAGDIFEVNDSDGLYLLDDSGKHIKAYKKGTQVEYIEMGYYKYNYQYYKVKVLEDGNVGYMACAYLTKVSNAPTPEPQPEPIDDKDKQIEELNAEIEELNNTIALKDKQIEELKNFITSSKCEFNIEEPNYYKIQMYKDETLCIKFAKDTTFEMQLSKDDIVKIK